MWRVRKKFGTKRKGLVERNQIVERIPKRKGHLGNKGSYDRSMFQEEEQIYLRKNVKKKLGKYDLGLFRGESIQKNGRFKIRVLSHSIPVHYTKERSVLEHMNLDTNLGKY